jgi:glycosyltransferase involved in cell wall biosynthesis
MGIATQENSRTIGRGSPEATPDQASAAAGQSILLLNQFFHPDTAATAQLLTDWAADLAHAGYRVRVVAAQPSYGDVGGTEPDPAGVQVNRTRSLPFGRSTLGRAASYLSYLAGAVWTGLRAPRQDFVITLTTPPLLALATLLFRKGAKLVIWEMDVYPDVAVALDHLPPNRVLSWLLDLPRRKAHAIIALGPCMRDRLLSHGLEAARIQVVENWADGQAIVATPLPPGPLRILYSGNFGLAHDWQTIAAAIEELRNEPVEFVFSGGGPHLDRVRPLPNVTVLPYSSRDSLGEHLAKCHLGLVTQKPSTLGCVVPSKTYGLLAAGRPLLFIGPRESTPARHVAQFGCGWQFECGDVTGVVEFLRTAAHNPASLAPAALAARAVFDDRFDRPLALAALRRVLES